MVLDGTVFERMTELKVIGVILNTKQSFESHIRSIATSASSKLGIINKALCLCVRELLSCLDVRFSFSSWSF